MVSSYFSNRKKDLKEIYGRFSQGAGAKSQGTAACQELRLRPGGSFRRGRIFRSRNLKNLHIEMPAPIGKSLRGPKRPYGDGKAKQLSQDGDRYRGEVRHLIGHEIRSAKKIAQEVTHQKAQDTGLPVMGRIESAGQLPPQNMGSMETEPEQSHGVKGLNKKIPRISFQQRQAGSADGQGRRGDLQLDQKRHPGVHQSQNIRKKGNPIRSSGKREARKLCPRHGFRHPGNAADPIQCVVMEDDKLSVPGQMHVQFDPVPSVNSGLKSRQGIFRNTFFCAVIASVGEKSA